MQINVSFDSSVTNAPTGFVAAVNYVVNYFDTLFTNNVTVSINVGYGEVAGQALPSNALGENSVSQYVSESYSAVVSALQAQGAPGSSTLPSTSPLAGSLYMPVAEAQALGLPTNGVVATNYAGFSSSAAFSYTANATPASNQYYFIGVVEHEFSEIMGRVSLINDQPNYYDPMDLYRFSAPGVHSTAPGGSGSTAYFSINNGVTNSGTWNNQTSNGDLGDLLAGGNDAFNDYSSPGVINAVSANDITLMQALGWTIQSSGGIAVNATTTAAIQGGASASVLQRSPVITDSASTTLAGATIKISNASGSTVAGDQLYVNGIQSGSLGNGLTASWNASTGTLTLSGSQTIAVYEALLGSVSYQDTGTDSSSGSHPVRDLTWTVNDGTNTYSAISQLTIDRAPVANNTATSDVAGSTVTATAATGVLANATDPDGDKLTVSGVSDATSGTGAVGSKLAGAYGHLTLNADGSYSYVADNSAAISSAPTGSHLQDSFTYTVSDGDGGSATATLTITLDRAPVANNTATSDVAGSTVTATAAAGVLANASDPDGDKLTVSGVSDATSGTGAVGSKLAGAYGHLTLNADGSYSYVADNSAAISSAPTGSHLQDSFTYTVSDGDGGTATATLTITLDRAPFVQVANVALAGAQTSAAASSLLNASDPDGDAITTYAFKDSGNGHFILSGVVQANNQEIDVSAAQLAHLTYQSAGGADTVQVRVYDGTLWSGWQSFAVTGSGSVVIQTDGSTSLVQVGANYFLNPVAGGTGPELKYNGSPVYAGEFASSPIGAVQVSGGYDVAWKNASTGQFAVWNTNSNGGWLANLASAVAGNSTRLESFETIFHQDLNGDGVIGIPTVVIQTDGSTSLVQVGANYFLNPVAGGTGPELKYNGSPVYAGEFASSPIGAVQVSGGYDVAWKNASTGQFAVWNTNSNGGWLANLASAVAGNSTRLESFETIFHQDLNGDGVIGIPTVVIQTDGSTSLVQVGANYFLNPVAGGTGPELKYNGSPVYAGEFASSPIGAVQVSGGYDVAWKNASTGQFTVWNTNSNGGWLANPASAVAGNSTRLESFETIFHQDLNGDGVIGTPPATQTATIQVPNVQLGSPTFEGTTLTLDHPSTFAGQIVGFTGNGTLAGSEQIDLRGLNYNLMHFSFNNASETLTVSDGSTTAKLQFLGQYSQDNFHFAGDGSGGTMVFSSATSGQTTASAVQAGAAGQNTVAHIGEQDTFVFAPNFGHVTLAGFAPATDTIQFSKSVFADISALLAAVYNDPSGNAVITDAAHDTITIQHVNTAQLRAHQSDFHFV